MNQPANADIAMNPTRRARLVFLATALGTFIVTANVSTMNVAFPDLESTFSSTSRASLTWVLNAYTISFAALLIPSGRLADRFGRRQTFQAGLLVFACASILVGFGPTFPVVIVARVAQGIGGALVVPASLGLLLATTPDSDRMTVVAKWGAVTALGVATGPSIGAFIVDTLSWRWAFLLLPPFCALSYIAGNKSLPRTETDSDAPFPDVLGAILLAGAMAVLAFAIVQIRPWGWVSSGVLTSIGLASLLFGALLVRCRNHRAPALPLHLFRIRSLAFANLATAIQSGSLAASLLVNILWLTEGWGFSIFEAGLATAPSPIFVALIAPRIGRLGTRYGVRTFAVPGSFIWGIGQVLYATQVTPDANWIGLWLPVSLMIGLGVALTFPLVSAAAVANVDPAEFAVAGAINQVARQIGATVGIAILITLVGETGDLGSFQQAWWFVAAMGPIAALSVFLIGRT